MRDRVLPTHLRRGAYVYVRQSTTRQVHGNAESRQRQYALGERAMQLGWVAEAVTVIDEDQGKSGSKTEGRRGMLVWTAPRFGRCPRPPRAGSSAA